MPRYSLVPHPDHPPRTVHALNVEVRGGHDDVTLTYDVAAIEKVVQQEWLPAERADDLWRTTCFELFLQEAGKARYFEFNFSPSTRWAAYTFGSYRDNRTHLAREVPPHIERIPDGVEVDCDLGGLPDGLLRMGLCAVIEETDGTKSYWALAHAPGPPDFHNPACFTAHLPPPARP